MQRRPGDSFPAMPFQALPSPHLQAPHESSRPGTFVHRPSARPLELAPLVLLEQNATELGQGVCPHVVERREDALPVVDRQRDDSGLEPERLLEEGACRLVDEAL